MPVAMHSIQWREVVYVCDKCREGEMVRVETNFWYDRPGVTHACGNCGNQQLLDRIYPYTEYERREAP